jgi:copper resistance protein D
VISPMVAIVMARLAFDTAAVVLCGAWLFLYWIGTKRLRAMLLVMPDVTAVTRIAPVVMCLAAIAWLPCDAATIAGSWGGAIDPGFLGKLAFGTSAGLAWVARCILSFLAILILRSWIGRARIPVAGASLASLSLSGHTALQSGSLGLIHVVNDAVHLLAGSFWLGSLFLLPGCLALLQVPELYKEAGVTLQRFSTIGHAAVALVLLTGIINSILTLQQWPTKLNSPYVALLAFKILLVVGMAGLALINRYVLVPKMRTNRATAIARIRLGTWSELALGAGVLTLVAIIGVLDPR